MTRTGCHFRRWFVPLAADDVVIFRNETRPEFRGRKLNPTLMLQALQAEAATGSAYIDCRTDNHSSIRSIERTGFRRIATLRPPPIEGQFRELSPDPTDGR
jgi:RimJ/RimL family protein N-acetyltransferase